MADATKAKKTGNKSSAGATGSVVVDKNKSPQLYIEEASEDYIIPGMVRKNFPDLIKLIYETESMNREEREYWMQILPIMSEDQISKFRGILINEKEQLSKLDNEYEEEIGRINDKHNSELNEVELKQKLEHIKQQETMSEKRETAKEDALLNQLKDL